MKNTNAKVAAEMLRLARQLAAADGDDEEAEVVDEAFTAKITSLRQGLMKIRSKKNMRLQKYGIGMIRPQSKVSDLVEALLKVTSAQ